MENKERLRMCVVCRERSNKKTLVRIVKNKDGEIFVDESGKANGRGAYICKDKNCFEKAKKQKAFNRAFKCNVQDEVYQKLEEYFE